MARARSAAGPEVRERYAAGVRYLEGLHADLDDGENRFTAELARIEAGESVIVQHGWQIDLAPDSGPFCLEPDGKVRPVEAVYVDPDAEIGTVSHYRRPDGTVVR